MTVEQIRYFDSDKQKDSSRRFSMVEKKRMVDIFDAINKVLAEYHHPGRNGNNEIEGYLPSMGTCDCCGKPITFYDIRLKSSVVSMGEIYDIEEALDKLGLILININANFSSRRFSLYIGEIHGHNQPTTDDEVKKL
jgi:hypothetical protein